MHSGLGLRWPPLIPRQGPSKSSGDNWLRSMRLLLRECPGVETGLPSHDADGVRNGDLAGLENYSRKFTFTCNRHFYEK